MGIVGGGGGRICMYCIVLYCTACRFLFFLFFPSYLPIIPRMNESLDHGAGLSLFLVACLGFDGWVYEW